MMLQGDSATRGKFFEMPLESISSDTACIRAGTIRTMGYWGNSPEHRA